MRGRYNPRAEGHIEPETAKLGNGKTVRLWVLSEKLGDEGDARAQSVIYWLTENGYRYVCIHGAGNSRASGWVHRNQPCPECGIRFDVDGRCMMGCINH